MIVAFLSISGAVHGRGPFVTNSPAQNVLSLQLFLVVISLPPNTRAERLRNELWKILCRQNRDAEFARGISAF